MTEYVNQGVATSPVKLFKGALFLLALCSPALLFYPIPLVGPGLAAGTALCIFGVFFTPALMPNRALRLEARHAGVTCA